MATVPEFISVLRKIRDVIYPEIKTLYEDSVELKESIDVGKAEFDADFAQFNTDYDTFVIQKNQVDVAITSAQASASSASASATIATNKSNEIKAITVQSTTGAQGTSASASYNPTDGKFTFVIPQGSKGDKGESFTVNSSGATAQRALYDAQPAGWSFLDVTTSTLYFKASNTSGDWSSGVPFGKGDKGDTGDTGVGIESFTYVSTNHISGLPAQSGGTDTYRVTLTNTLTFDYQVYNGLDAELTYVDEQVEIVQENIDTISTQIANHINLSGVTAYNLLQGNLSVSNEIITNGFGIFTYTGNSTTPPSINLGMDITSQWGNDTSETFGYLIKIKSRSVSGDWTYIDSVRGITKYISSNTTAVEGTDANMFTLNTVAGVTTLTIGSSIRTNVTGITYVVEVHQTTHRISGTTNQAKAYACHYNPTMGFSINKYEGSGLIGHEIPHMLGRRLAFVTARTLTAVTDWEAVTETSDLRLNTNSAGAITNKFLTDNAVSLNNSSNSNQSGQQCVMYGWANSYLDESNKLIGNYKIGIYQGSGVIDNKITTRGKPAWVMIKRLDGIGNWRIYDNQRPQTIFASTSAAETTENSKPIFNSNNFNLSTTDMENNAIGGQYLYMVVYDNDSGSGKSKYPRATDSSNVQINNTLIPLAHGIDSNGSKNSIVVANETITGLTYTVGKNYLYKTDTGYGVTNISPSYGKTNPLIGDFYNVITNKWYSNTNAEITESRNYLNHIVHADQNGQVTYVEELPKIEYKDIVKANEYQGKNACTALGNFDGTTTPPTIKNSTGFASIVRLATSVYDIYFTKNMDNLNYSVFALCNGVSAINTITAIYTKYLNKVTVSFINTANNANLGINPSDISIHIDGGKN